MLNFGEDEFKPVPRQFQVRIVRGQIDPHEKVGVEVVLEAGEDGLLGQESAADSIVSFNDKDFHTGAGEITSADETVVAAADNDCVKGIHQGFLWR
jgi:hypothetical protein